MNAGAKVHLKAVALPIIGNRRPYFQVNRRSAKKLSCMLGRLASSCGQIVIFAMTLLKLSNMKARLPDLDIVTKRSQLSFSEFFRNSQTKTTYSTLHTTKQKLSANHGLGFTPKSRLHVLFGPQYRLGSSYGFNFVRRQLHG